MHKYFSSIILPLLFVFGCFSISNAQTKTEAGLKIGGELSRPFSISSSGLQKMPRITVTRNDRDNKAHQYTGVLLSQLLVQGGATMGNELRGENLTKYVIVEASDGYQVIFALAELDAAFSDNKIIVADTIDGAPLAAADGPFRIIVQDDKRPARCIKQVNSIKIGFAKS